MGREDQEALLSAVVASEEVDTTQVRFPTGEVLGDIYSLALNTDRPISQVIAERYRRFFPLPNPIEWIQKRYEERKRAANAMDFDDLLVKILEVFKTKPDTGEFYQRYCQ